MLAPTQPANWAGYGLGGYLMGDHVLLWQPHEAASQKQGTPMATTTMPLLTVHGQQHMAAGHNTAGKSCP